MRTDYRLVLTLAASACVLASCGGARSSQTPARSLQRCGSLELRVEGADVVLQANADGTVSAATVVSAPNARARTAAERYVAARYGDPHPDTRYVEKPWHFGLVRRFDLCGRPLPLPAPSRVSP